MKISCQSSYSNFKNHVVMILCDMLKYDFDESSDIDTIIARIDIYDLSQILSM